MSTDPERAAAKFSTRSPKRDAAIDEARIALLEESIDTVIRGLIAERTGLARRVKRLLDEPEALATWISANKMPPPKSELERAERRLRLLDRQILECRPIKRAIANMRVLAGGARPSAGV
ncbi:hypothetical protein CVM73_20660 [Bradyrhizobium forestalis]|uniref:Uncharacterized protein n=1 Tax=Bradyrhizobium forestalis TaxID=1419263 RepID=A0A2M8R665_9BRAD|nr:hypothetical protein [Bradyrhizobium forestalis]PJG53322.1 hypothetical protein CVM73_20660 [Bradyrhizobium forestalis]